MYKGWDCHAYTQDCVQLWLSMRPLYERKTTVEGLATEMQTLTIIDSPDPNFVQLTLPMPDNEIGDLIKSIQDFLMPRFPENLNNQLCWQAVQKMRARCLTSRGGYEDGHLADLNIIRLLEAVWEVVKKLNEESIYMLFVETLEDIQLTCPEGDSHRLLMLFTSLQRMS
jgi:hypothetical protein